MLKGGTNSFRVVLTQALEILAMLKRMWRGGGRMAQGVSVLSEIGGRKRSCLEGGGGGQKFLTGGFFPFFVSLPPST